MMANLESGNDLFPLISNLTDLRISLSTEPLIWVNTFRELQGIPLLIKILQQSERQNTKGKSYWDIMLQLILSLKAIMNNQVKTAFTMLNRDMWKYKHGCI
jgi:hypothetical protein